MGAAIVGAEYWRAHPKELAEALARARAPGAPEEPTSKRDNASGKPLRSDGSPALSATKLTLTVEEAAALLGISRAFAYDAVKRNEIPHIKIGRRILIPKSALDRLLEQNG